MRSVLVIEDNPDHFELVQDALLENASAAPEVHHRTHLEAGLNALDEHDFDIVLCDLSLPDASIEDTIQRLKETEIDVPVVVLTSLKSIEIAKGLAKHGIQDYLPKDELTGALLQRICLYAIERKQNERELEQQKKEVETLAQRDALTGLLNRYCFESILEAAFAKCDRSSERLALLFIDLDNFKTVNDTMGHDAGDQLLIEIAERLKTASRDSDVLARLGGDEFVVLANDIQTDARAAQIAQRILNALEPPAVIGGANVDISASIGIAVLDESRIRSKNDLMKCADMAMYRAKESGKNRYCFFSQSLQHEVAFRNQIEQDVKKAITAGDIDVYYQPLFDANTKALRGVEALARWRHPSLGSIDPEDFISAAEEIGAMPALGNLVLEQACTALADWQQRRPDLKVKMAVNLSASQLHWHDLVKQINAVVAEHGVSPQNLELEITERSIISDIESVAKVLEALSDCSIRLSLDDFGTGFSSLEHISMFPISVLKIDRRFVMSQGENEKQDRLLVAIIQFAKALQLRVIAEGVETAAQADFCRRHGCDVLQGFFFSKPLTRADFEARYINRQQTPSLAG